MKCRLYSFVLLTLGVALCSCSTKPLYQRWTGDEGYHDSTLNLSLVRQQSGIMRVVDKTIKDSTFLVEFYGSRLEEDAWCAAMYRVAEFTLEHGHEYFTILHDTIVLSTTISAATENNIIGGPRSAGENRIGGQRTGAGDVAYGVNSAPRPISRKTFTVGDASVANSQSAREVLKQYAGEIRRPTN